MYPAASQLERPIKNLKANATLFEEFNPHDTAKDTIPTMIPPSARSSLLSIPPLSPAYLHLRQLLTIQGILLPKRIIEPSALDIPSLKPLRKHP